MPTSFHLAITVHDLGKARQFYGDLLGCPEGRSTEDWVDFDFFGHQLVCHRVEGSQAKTRIGGCNEVDGDQVSVPHFGVVLPFDHWEELAGRLSGQAVDFIIGPRVRFQGLAGEQGTFFIADLSGNTLEFKGFKDLGQLFARD